jgi:hypothetical protein
VISSIITLLGMLSPQEPANEAVPQARRRELHHDSGGQISEKRVHRFLQNAGPAGSQRLTVPFSFRIGLWPIGSRRLVDDDEHSLCVDKRCAGPHVTGPPREPCQNSSVASGAWLTDGV